MIFKLGMCVEKNWRRLNGFDFLGKVITGVKFKDGIEETTDKTTEVKTDNQVARLITLYVRGVVAIFEFSIRQEFKFLKI